MRKHEGSPWLFASPYSIIWGWFCRQFETLHTGVKIDTHIEVEEERIPDELKIVIFRVMQEAFNNIAKYSEADRIALLVQRRDGSLELGITDNGVGFHLARLRAGRVGGGGLGLTSIRKRVEFSMGAFAIESEAGGGTTVRATWNLSRLVKGV